MLVVVLLVVVRLVGLRVLLVVRHNPRVIGEALVRKVDALKELLRAALAPFPA